MYTPLFATDPLLLTEQNTNSSTDPLLLWSKRALLLTEQKCILLFLLPTLCSYGAREHCSLSHWLILHPIHFLLIWVHGLFERIRIRLNRPLIGVPKIH